MGGKRQARSGGRGQAPGAGPYAAQPGGAGPPGWPAHPGASPGYAPGMAPGGQAPRPQAPPHQHAEGKGGHGHECGRGRHGRQAAGSSEEEDGEDYDDDCEDSAFEEDMQHFADVCYSLVRYSSDAAGELRWFEEAFENLKDPNDRELLAPTMNPRVLKEMRARVAENGAFLKMLVESDEEARQFSVIPEGYQVQERNSVKVHTVLRQFVRDWAAEGAPERESQYGCLLRALEKYIPLGCATSGPYARPGGKPQVLTPGSGLARLPFEVARMGYRVQGNEFSYHMLQGSKWVLNESTGADSHVIYPFVLSLEHRRGATDHMRGTRIPDIWPSGVLCPQGAQTAELSMCAGEFVEVYSPQEKAWDAVLTCFFLDTAKNIFLYIRTIAHIIRPGGLWANIGPLLYHYAEQANSISVELSWEEIKPAIEKYFIFKEEDVREAYYTTNASGLFHTRYRCKYFVAIRNDTPASGKSFPVF